MAISLDGKSFLLTPGTQLSDSLVAWTVVRYSMPLQIQWQCKLYLQWPMLTLFQVLKRVLHVQAVQAPAVFLQYFDGRIPPFFLYAFSTISLEISLRLEVGNRGSTRDWYTACKCFASSPRGCANWVYATRIVPNPLNQLVPIIISDPAP